MKILCTVLYIICVLLAAADIFDPGKGKIVVMYGNEVMDRCVSEPPCTQG